MLVLNLILTICISRSLGFSFLADEKVLKDYIENYRVVNHSVTTFNGCLQPKQHCVSWKQASTRVRFHCDPNPQCGVFKWDITWHGDAFFGGDEVCFRTNEPENVGAIVSKMRNLPICFHSDHLIYFTSEKYMSLRLWKDMCYHKVENNATVGDHNGHIQTDNNGKQFFWKNFIVPPYISMRDSIAWPMHTKDSVVHRNTNGAFAKKGVYMFSDSAGNVFMIYYAELDIISDNVDNRTVTIRPKVVSGKLSYTYKSVAISRYATSSGNGVINFFQHMPVLRNIVGSTITWEGKVIPQMSGHSLIDCDRQLRCDSDKCKVNYENSCATKFVSVVTESWFNNAVCSLFEALLRAVISIFFTITVDILRIAKHTIVDFMVTMSIVTLIALSINVLLYVFLITCLDSWYAGSILYLFLVFLYFYLATIFANRTTMLTEVYEEMAEIYRGAL